MVYGISDKSCFSYLSKQLAIRYVYNLFFNFKGGKLSPIIIENKSDLEPYQGLIYQTHTEGNNYPKKINAHFLQT